MLRRSTSLLKCGRWLCYVYRQKLHSSAAVLYSPRDRDLPNPNLPTPLSKLHSSDTDILLEQIRKSRTVERVLELTSMHLDVMNSRHIVTCMESIHDFTKGDNTAAEHLKQNQTFQALCTRLMQIVRFLDSQEVINVYKTLASLGVRSNTYVMQSVLKIIGSHLNDMSLGQLTFLNFLLSRQRHNALVDGLRMALPLVLQVQIDQQLDSDNVTDVVNCLQVASRSRLKPETIQKVLAALLNKANVLSAENAVTVIFSLLNLEIPVDGYKELVNSSFDILSKNIESITPRQIIAVVRTARSQDYYHSAFFFAAADRAVREKWNLQNTYELFSNFYKLDFSPPNVLDHLVHVICTESEELEREPEYSLLNIVEYLTTTGYRPVRVDEAVNILCSCRNKLLKLKEKSPIILIKFLSCLSMLGHFPQNLIAEILDEDYLFNAWSQCRKQGRADDFEHSIFSFVWSLEVYDQKENFAVPVTILKKLTQTVCERFLDFDCPLKKFIENGLGGSQFLLSGVFTNDGHVIDHILAMRSGNYPVALQNNDADKGPLSEVKGLTFTENIVLPDDAKLVAILVAPENQYCRDPEVLKGWMELKVKSLAKKKYSPVVIHYSNWRNLPDREKIPYLMREIKQAIQDDGVFKTTSLS